MLPADEHIDQPYEREFYAASAASLADLVSSLNAIMGDFALLLAVDANEISEEDLESFARSCLARGLVYFCGWGPGCSHVEDVFDNIAVSEGFEWESDTYVHMTTSHPNELLDEAFFFFSHSAFPASPHPEQCKSWVSAAIANEAWHQELLTLNSALASEP